MHYIIDGYNLLFRVLNSDDELQKQREFVLKELTVKLEFLAIDTTIVFDAAFQLGGVTRSRQRYVEVVYTAAGESADNFIIEQLRECDHPKREIVVTSDKKLAWRARRFGAKTLAIDPFVLWLDNRYFNKLRKERRQQKEGIKPAKAPIRVVHPIVEESPKAKNTPEACFEYYAYTFEQCLQEEPSPKKPKEPILSDTERYLQAFIKRLEEDEEVK